MPKHRRCTCSCKYLFKNIAVVALILVSSGQSVDPPQQPFCTNQRV